ncbi:beta-ketoacyl synthase N-terminal-like domain-containing protein [Streptomyces bingchenggensis]|uniref:beta-ketoacyl synthase N-terminal-like domain-containing protein n=1 Tax=Streptomyces TaxID=1883 RepID=UPI001930DD6C
MAIVGAAGRYPLAETPAELWDNLAAGRHCIREVPADRWDADTHYDPAGVRGLGLFDRSSMGMISDRGSATALPDLLPTAGLLPFAGPLDRREQRRDPRSPP